MYPRKVHGEVIANRFEVRRVAGAGGMSIVYRATDRTTGAPVAVKILRDSDTDTHAARFNREGKLLAKLDHPGIVRYVAHGATNTGELYLAIEWLEGEDLARRLRRAEMTVPETMVLAKRIAGALGFAHQHNILHRDIKPSNLFLQRGRVDAAKILDFGIARHRQAEVELTAVGTRLGTPAYMSPEQARGNTNIDARSDVFSLGCVIFQCLTRRRPFFGSDPTALIAKILLEEAPRVRKLRPEVPAALDDLIARMLAKKRSQRPADAAAVAAELATIPNEDDGATTQNDSPAALLTGRERRLHSVVMAYGITQSSELKRLGAVASMFAGRFAKLPDGALVITLSGTDAAIDLAAKAARCALAVQALAKSAAIALAIGRDIIRSEHSTVGPVIDQVARLLRNSDFTVPTRMLGRHRAGVPGGDPESELTAVTLDLDQPQPIRVDPLTANLLDGRFTVVAVGEEHHLLGESGHVETVRTLLAQRTKCVAREAELGTLHALFDACVEEPEAHVVLVVAASGIGKSRLRYEFIQRLHSDDADFQLLLGHGDPLRSGAPFGMLASAIRQAAGVRDGEPIEEQRAKLRTRVGRHLSADVADQITEFIGEMTAVPFPADDSVQLRAARQDALLMGDQIRRAATSWLGAECRAIPTLLVLEDLHWGDLPTVRFIDDALRALCDDPFMVIGLARPEIDDLFSQLWVDRGVHVIRLGALTKKASRKLVRQVLGVDVAEETVARIVDRAMGNAFFLEELIRAAVDGDTSHPPETVIATVQTRLEKMEPSARRILRAASIFGRFFWRDGVATMLGEEDDEIGDVGSWLSALTEREVVVLRNQSRFPGQLEYAFRHDLVREAAYAMLTDADRHAGHLLAGGWLESLGDSEAIVLAQHFERGRKPKRAVRWYRRAAEQAMVGNDFSAALDHIERGIVCGATTEELGRLRLIQADALNWKGDFARATSAALEAKHFLPEKSAAWYAAIGELATAAGVQGDIGQLHDAAAAIDIEDLDVGDTCDHHLVWAATRLAEQLIAAGSIDHADTILIALGRHRASLDEKNPGAVARILSAQASRACFDGAAGKNLEYVDDAVDRFERAGDLRNACVKLERSGYARMDLGLYDEADKLLRQALERAQALGLNDVAATARTNLGLTLGRLGQWEEGYQIELEAAVAFRASGNRRMQAIARSYLALIRLEEGDPRAAEREAHLALDVASTPTPLPFSRALALATMASALLAQDHSDSAFVAAFEALKIVEEHAGIGEGESLIRLTCARAMHAVGQHETAVTLIAAARDRVLSRADRLDEPWQRSFLAIPENALTLSLAAEWASEPEPDAPG